MQKLNKKKDVCEKLKYFFIFEYGKLNVKIMRFDKWMDGMKK